MKKHYLDQSYKVWTIIVMSLLCLTTLLVYPTKIAMIISASFLPLLIIPFALRSFVIIRNGQLHRHSIGGKNESAELSIPINQIQSIQILSIDQQSKAISLSTNNRVIKLKGKTMDQLISEIQALNENVVIN